MYLGSGTVLAGEPPKTYTVTGNVYLPHGAQQERPAGEPAAVPQRPLQPPAIRRPVLGRRRRLARPVAILHLRQEQGRRPDPGQFERTPSDEALNAVHTYGDKLLELGWVYTVIAGVLNIMVIYDAFAGPAFLTRKTDLPPKATA